MWGLPSRRRRVGTHISQYPSASADFRMMYRSQLYLPDSRMSMDSWIAVYGWV